jgi:hypothetical protein
MAAPFLKRTTPTPATGGCEEGRGKGPGGEKNGGEVRLGSGIAGR